MVLLVLLVLLGVGGVLVWRCGVVCTDFIFARVSGWIKKKKKQFKKLKRKKKKKERKKNNKTSLVKFFFISSFWEEEEVIITIKKWKNKQRGEMFYTDSELSPYQGLLLLLLS